MPNERPSHTHTATSLFLTVTLLFWQLACLLCSEDGGFADFASFSGQSAMVPSAIPPPPGDDVITVSGDILLTVPHTLNFAFSALTGLAACKLFTLVKVFPRELCRT